MLCFFSVIYLDKIVYHFSLGNLFIGPSMKVLIGLSYRQHFNVGALVHILKNTINFLR